MTPSPACVNLWHRKKKEKRKKRAQKFSEKCHVTRWGSQNNTIKTLLSHSHCLGSNASILQHDFNDKVHFSTNLAKKKFFFRFIYGCIRQYYRIGWFVKQMLFLSKGEKKYWKSLWNRLTLFLWGFVSIFTGLSLKIWSTL